MSEHYSVIVGEVGKGKSSFINAVLKCGESSEELCKTSSDGQRCTPNIDMKQIRKGDDKFFFIDTPGLNDGVEDDKNKEILRKEVSGEIEQTSRIKCILIVLTVTDYRLTASLKECIKEFMYCFPLSNFWEHVLVIRTHTKDEDEIEEVKGKFIQSIKQDNDLLEYMKEKNINYPNGKIKEFYVNSVVKRKQVNTDEKIKGTIDEILETIKKSEPLYKDIKYSDKKEKKLNNLIIIYQIMYYKDFNSDKWYKCEKIIETKGDKKVETEYIGSPYKKKCKKGKWQKCQDYFVTYSKDINKPPEKTAYGQTYEKRVS